MLLKDIMTKDVLTLSPNDSLEKAAELFVDHGISGAPVIDAFNNVIGMLTEGDLVRQQKPLTKPLFLMLFDGAIPVNLKTIKNEVEEMGATTVAQLMTQDVVSLHEYDPVSEAADYMIEKNINRVPIINDEGQLLGIVTRHDIVRATYLEHQEEKMTTETYDLQKALKLSVMLGAALMENGAEIYRVEESILFLLRAYGAKRIDVYALPNIIIVTIETSDEISYTKTRRIHHRSVDFERLIRLNDFSRKLSSNPIPPQEGIDALTTYCKGCGYSPPVIWLSYGLAAASFSMMSGGTFADAAVAILCVFMARVVSVPLELRHANDFFTTMIATYIQLVVAFVFSTYFSELHMNNIIVGTLMMLFPGRGFMTAVRDVIAKDLSAGLIEAIEAIVIAVAIAIGSALAYSTFPILVGVMPL